MRVSGKKLKLNEKIMRAEAVSKIFLRRQELQRKNLYPPKLILKKIVPENEQ